MASSYTTNNGVEKPGIGEQSNTWGVSLNADLDLIDTALDGVVTLSLSGTTTSLAITDGAASDGRNRILLCTGSLAANNTITLTPNDAEKYFFVYNNTTGGFSVIFAQGGGSGSTVTIANGYWAIVRCDGTGTNANVTRVLDSLEIGGTLKAAGLTITSAIGGADGSASAPTYSFSNDPNTGIYRTTTDSIGVSAGGTLRETISTTAITSTLPLLGAAGSASAPQYSFSGDTNSGMFSGGTDIVAIATGGSERVRVDASGNLCVASTTGYQKLTVEGQGVFLDNAASYDPGDGAGPAVRVGYLAGSDYGYVIANNSGVAAKPLLVGGSYTQVINGDLQVGGSAATAPVKPLTVEGQGVFLDKATTYNPSDSAGNCVRVGFDSGTTRGYVTSSTGSAGTNPLELVASSMVIDPGTGGIIIGSAGSTPGPSAGLQLTSTTRAFQLAPMTTTQRDALVAADAMIVYNSTTGKFQGRASGAWVDLH